MPPSPTLYDQRAQAVSEGRQLLERAETEGRDLLADEQAHYERVDAEVDRLNGEIEKQERLAAAKNGRPAPAPDARPGTDGAALSWDFGGYSIGNRGGIGDHFLSGRDARRAVIMPGTPAALRATDTYRTSFLRYLQDGRSSLAMQVSKDNQGGYLAPIQFVMRLIKFLDDNVFMRQLATVLPPMPSAVNIGAPSWDTDPNDADWTAEIPASDISEDDAARVGQREMMPQLLTKLVKLSLKLLRAATMIDPESYLLGRIGYKVAITEEKAFLTGTGSKQPLGVYVASNDGVPTSRDVTASSATAFTADDIINLLFNLKEQYQKNATGLFSREFVKRARKLKDGNGQYLWQPGLSSQPNTVLDRPYVMSEYVPSTYTTGLYVGMFADFKAGYWIADSLELTIQRLVELFALKNQVGIVARKETDGQPVLAEAFSRLKLG